MVGPLPRSWSPILAVVGCLERAVAVQPCNVGRWCLVQRGLCELLDELVLGAGTAAEQPHTFIAPLAQCGKVVRLHVAVPVRISQHSLAGQLLERLAILRYGYERAVRILAAEIVHYFQHLDGLRCRIRVGNDAYVRFQLLEPFPVSVQIRVPEIVVEDIHRQIHVRILAVLERTVLPEPDRITAGVRICGKRVSGQEPDELCLFRRTNLVPVLV